MREEMVVYTIPILITHSEKKHLALSSSSSSSATQRNSDRYRTKEIVGGEKDGKIGYGARGNVVIAPSALYFENKSPILRNDIKKWEQPRDCGRGSILPSRMA